VERTFTWLGRWRRTSKDYEYLPTSSACVIELAMICLMLCPLAESETWCLVVRFLQAILDGIVREA
jgi:putative transposase